MSWLWDSSGTNIELSAACCHRGKARSSLARWQWAPFATRATATISATLPGATVELASLPVCCCSRQKVRKSNGSFRLTREITAAGQKQSYGDRPEGGTPSPSRWDPAPCPTRVDTAPGVVRYRLI